MKLLIISSLLVGGISTTACLAAAAVTDSLSFASSSYTIPESIVNGTATSAISTTTTPFFMPSGCTCKQSSSPSNDSPAASSNNNDDECHQFDCDCQCDLTAGVCDINCCCDPECSAAEITTFSNCLAEGEGPSPIVKMCVDRPLSLEAVNLQYPLRLSDSPEDKLQGLMCVEKDNSAVKGNFFKDQGYPSASQAFSPGGQGSNQLGFHSYSNREATATTSATMDVNYQLGDKIAAYHHAHASSNVLTNAFGGYLVLPSADESGNCLGLNTVSFGKSEAHTCTKHTNDLALDCESQFSTARYISNVLVEKTKGSAIFGIASSQTQVNNSSGLLPIRIDKFTNSSGVTLSNLDEENSQQTTWDQSTLTCTNALKQMTYNVRYNHTSIVDISVEIETIDIQGAGSEATRQSISLQQDFAVNFIPVEVETFERSHGQNNIITRIRSGNPGYRVGAPTLGAMSLDDTSQTASYVIAQGDGFTIMDTGLIGQCNTSSPTGLTVGFAKNIYVGCTQEMTRQELKEFCIASSSSNQEQHPMLASYKIGSGTAAPPTDTTADHFLFPKWLETNQALLGIFGSADPLDRRQWIKIESPLDDSSFTIKSRSFVEAENRCIGMPSRLRFDILWTYVGNVDNPQAKILSAKKSFEDGPTLQHALPPNEKQPYSFITTVSWTFLEPKYETVKSPPPTLIFSVPHDVFYPFQIMNNGADTCLRFYLWWLTLVVSLIVLMY